MGVISSQFLDNIEFIDSSENKLLVFKYTRYKDEIKQGAKLTVRNGQAAVFVHEGQIADIFGPGQYSLQTGNLPILSTLAAFPYAFNSPIKSDVYFVNTTFFINNKWGTKNPIIKRDDEMGVVRITSFGTFSFRIIDINLFMEQVFGARNLSMTYDIIQYLNSFIGESIAEAIGNIELSVIDLAGHYRELSNVITPFVNEKACNLGIEITEATIENIGLPSAVEKMIDEQSGIGLASKNMNNFVQYQSARAIRDAAQQPMGMAGIGVSMSAGRKIAETMSSNFESETNVKSSNQEGKANAAMSIADTLIKYKELLDSGVLNQDEFDLFKKNLLKDL